MTLLEWAEQEAKREHIPLPKFTPSIKPNGRNEWLVSWSVDGKVYGLGITVKYLVFPQEGDGQ